MPKGSSQMRLKAIQDEGADASITDFNYDDAVRLANEKAKENNWIIQKNEAQEEYICPDISTNGVSLFRKEDYKTYKMNNLVDGKIKLILYKLEK